MKAAFDTRGASAHQLKMLADWVRSISTEGNERVFDVIRFIEIDLQKLIPGLGIFIEPDHDMGASRAFVSDDPLGIVISESIYEGASAGDLFSTEVILHEIGHVFLHRKYTPLNLNSSNNNENRIRNTSNVNNAEWQANTFAMCLLYRYSENAANLPIHEVQRRYRATLRQANRILNHFRRLAIREQSRNVERDRRWLQSVVEGLDSPVSVDEPLGEQLSFFYRRPVVNVVA